MRLDHLLLRKGIKSVCVHTMSVISFPVMSKDMTNAENESSISMKFFEITKEGRKHTGISSAVC